MANNVLLLVFSCLVFFGIVNASDPNILTDFIVPANMTTVDGSFFTFTQMRGILDAPTPPDFKATQASMVEFPALNGQSVSFSVLWFAPRAVSAPHARPHATGLLFVLVGSLEVGFVDSSNKLYTQKLQTGDMFIFPKGLLHYQYNANPDVPAMAVVAFGSASAGTVSVPGTLFNTGIDERVLAKSFKTDVATIRKIRVGLAPPKA